MSQCIVYTVRGVVKYDGESVDRSTTSNGPSHTARWFPVGERDSEDSEDEGR